MSTEEIGLIRSQGVAYILLNDRYTQVFPLFIQLKNDINIKGKLWEELNVAYGVKRVDDQESI